MGNPSWKPMVQLRIKPLSRTLPGKVITVTEREAGQLLSAHRDRYEFTTRTEYDEGRKDWLIREYRNPTPPDNGL